MHLVRAEPMACGLPVITTNEPPMNEFILGGENGKLVDVAYHETRNDNYYWQQSYCDLNSLIKSMIFYIDKIDDLPQFKEKARLYALNHLDWNKNANVINSIIKNINVIHRNYDKELVQKVKFYEEIRIRTSARITHIEKLKNIIRKSHFYPIFILY